MQGGSVALDYAVYKNRLDNGGVALVLLVE